MIPSFLRQCAAASRVGRKPGPAVPARTLFLALLLAGSVFACAPTALEKRFTDLLQEYPATEGPLRIPSLSSAPALPSASDSGGRDVIIMVHPGYSLFFRSRERNLHSEVKYDLLKFQLDSEAESIRKIVQSGHPLILVIPGNYQRESVAPLSYTFFLNSLTEGGTSVFSIFSESASSGTLSTDTMVTLFRQLQAMRVDRILVGGGYIGRCEREFYNQLATYLDNIPSFIVPELSLVSPDDITDKEAHAMLDGLQQKDFSLIRQLIERRSQKPNILSPVQSPVL